VHLSMRDEQVAVLVPRVQKTNTQLISDSFRRLLKWYGLWMTAQFIVTAITCFEYATIEGASFSCLYRCVVSPMYPALTFVYAARAADTERLPAHALSACKIGAGETDHTLERCQADWAPGRVYQDVKSRAPAASAKRRARRSTNPSKHKF
jgi:hypothetical protein